MEVFSAVKTEEKYSLNRCAILISNQVRHPYQSISIQLVFYFWFCFEHRQK